VRAHMIKQALYSLEELATAWLVTRIVGHSLRDLVGTALKLVNLPLEAELTKIGRAGNWVPLADLF